MSWLFSRAHSKMKSCTTNNAASARMFFRTPTFINVLAAQPFTQPARRANGQWLRIGTSETATGQKATTKSGVQRTPTRLSSTGQTTGARHTSKRFAVSTELTLVGSISKCRRNAVCVLAAVSHSRGATSSPLHTLTTATIASQCADCSATAATASSDSAKTALSCLRTSQST